VGTYFRGYYFLCYVSCAHDFVDSTVRVITSFINSVRGYGRLVTERKRKNFDPYAVSVMKERNS